MVLDGVLNVIYTYQRYLSTNLKYKNTALCYYILYYSISFFNGRFQYFHCLILNFLLCDRMCHIWMLLLTCQNTTNPRICWILRRGCQALIAFLCTLSHPSPPLTLSGTTALLPHPVKVSCLASVHHFFPPFLSVYYYSSFCFLFSHFYISVFFFLFQIGIFNLI